MSKSNLRQYAKIGFGLDFIIEGALVVYKHISQNTVMAQEMFHRAEQIGLDTMQRANDLGYSFASGKNLCETLVQAGLIIGGGMLLASGIYNLAKSYKAETEK